MNDTIRNTTYKRDKIPSINSKKSERVYNFDDGHLVGYQGKASYTFKRPLLSSPRRRPWKTNDSSSNLDDDDDESFESDDDGTSRKGLRNQDL